MCGSPGVRQMLNQFYKAQPNEGPLPGYRDWALAGTRQAPSFPNKGGREATERGWLEQKRGSRELENAIAVWLGLHLH